MKTWTSLTTVNNFSKFIALFVFVFFLLGSFLVGMAFEDFRESVIRFTVSTTTSTSATNEKTADLAEILNSGSTNAPGWQLLVKEDGSGVLRTQGGGNIGLGGLKNYPKSSFPSDKLAADLKNIGDVSGVIPSQPCVKSVSFGSSTKIVYNGHTSGDLTCISENDDKTFQDLASLVESISTQVSK